MWPAPACSPRPTGASNRAIWSASPSAPRKIIAVRSATNWKPRRTKLPSIALGSSSRELVALLGQLRQSAKRKSATEVVDELIAGLGLAPLPSDQDRYYLDRFVNFVKEWERKSEETQLRHFIEYLAYFYEAGGDICLEEEISDDAVQLMTVHAAKGLEFPHVFILRLSKNDFPSGVRKVEFEFPPELMKEEQPKFDFQIQEERRLFYVALTRARQQLTLSTLVNKRKKPSPFLDDFLTNAKIKTLRYFAITTQSHCPAGRRDHWPRSRFPGPVAIVSAGH